MSAGRRRFGRSVANPCEAGLLPAAAAAAAAAAASDAAWRFAIIAAIDVCGRRERGRRSARLVVALQARGAGSGVPRSCLPQVRFHGKFRRA